MPRPPESALLESRTLRDSVTGRVHALDKVKVLATLPDDLHVTTQMAAEYFEVELEAVKKVTQRHRAELTANGMVVLRGRELRTYQRDTMSLYVDNPEESYPQAITHLTLLSRRAVLNLAMLLRDSDVARRIRTYLLDVEETARDRRPGRSNSSLEARMRIAESSLAEVGPVLVELGPVLQRMSIRLEGLERRAETTEQLVYSTNRFVCAMSERLADLDARLRVREMHGS